MDRVDTIGWNLQTGRGNDLTRLVGNQIDFQWFPIDPEVGIERTRVVKTHGTQGIDTLDPPPLGNTELVDAKAKIGNQVFIKGNMNSVDLLAAKTEEEVINHATDRILTGKPGGGYILSTACSVSPRMEPWKLELLVPLAEEIGRYE